MELMNLMKKNDKNLQGRVTEHPNWISFWDQCIWFFGFHKAVLPWTSSRDNISVISIDTSKTLAITWGCVSLKRWINVHATFCIPWIALIAVTGSSENFISKSQWASAFNEWSTISTYSYQRIMPGKCTGIRINFWRKLLLRDAYFFDCRGNFLWEWIWIAF